MIKNVLFAVTVAVGVNGCAVINADDTIAADSIAFENFNNQDDASPQRVQLMCHNQMPTEWNRPLQFEQGQHKLWVQATLRQRDVPASEREAYVLLEAELDGGKRYMLNRSIDDDTITVWVQERETGKQVSNAVSATLAFPSAHEQGLKSQRCKSGTV
ncbi:hypothetical protein LJ739_03620 [Aestuariibacter halophilus]|uniref:Lipoprotein n=1 Tax=Fluctibacter halophilus TaxID=226011 RepID=A0ABS8G6K6_9ALTE|nr:hypothetical protein [Aestuariibacter halophilus]MCC2615324.1 hypothetical protein [Aestuariibacter halophilus]